MKNIILMMSMVMVLLASCTISENAVKYVEARNYFHRNDAPLPQNLKMTSQAEFDQHFSPAAFMGKNGEPTKINFNKNFIIAKVLPPTDKETELTPLKVEKIGKNQLHVVYSLHVGPTRSYTIQPMFILVLNKKYKNYNIEDVEEK